MLKKKLIIRDPLRLLNHKMNDNIDTGGIGAIIARAGVGKTAFLVQIALSTLIKEKNVLHISVQDPVDKVNLWYQEIFQNLTFDYETGQKKQLWDELLGHRFIMAFETESFNFQKIKKRIEELKNQNIFSPDLTIIDGLLLEKIDRTEIMQFKDFLQEQGISLWLSIGMHRHDEYDSDKMLSQLDEPLKNMFDMIFQLIPEKQRIRVKRINRDTENNTQTAFCLDPSTLLLKEADASTEPA